MNEMFRNPQIRMISSCKSVGSRIVDSVSSMLFNRGVSFALGGGPTGLAGTFIFLRNVCRPIVFSVPLLVVLRSVCPSLDDVSSRPSSYRLFQVHEPL